MFHLAIELNSEPVKYAILALTAPMWIPFAKALWRTLDDSLREEGGLLGEPPTPEKLAELEERYGKPAEQMVSDPKKPEDAAPIGAQKPSGPRPVGTRLVRRRGFR